MRISKKNQLKLKTTALLLVTLFLMVVGADYVADYFGGSGHVPEWAYYLSMISFAVPVAYAFSACLEAFDDND